MGGSVTIFARTDVLRNRWASWRAGRAPVAKGFVSQLRSVGFSEFEIIPIDQLDLMSATLRKEPRRASINPGGPPRP